MIEPTESENLEEIDRFCEAMISIRKEIEQCSKEDKNNLLCNAPHTMKMISSEKWNHPYSREIAAFPTPFVIENKFWPTVRRVDDAYGDRNLMCTCAPMETYIEAG
jgi:glycine dehydrogenase